MKIALVIERMDTSRGGRETSTSQIAAAMAAAGHAVTVLCQGGGSEIPGVTVQPLGRRGLWRRQQMPNFAADAASAIAAGGFDVSHAMLPIIGADFYQLRGGTMRGRALAAIRRRGPVFGPIADAMDRMSPLRRRMADIEQQVIADTRTGCLCVSRMVADELEHLYNRRDGVRVVYNAVGTPAVDAERRADWRQRRRFELGATREDPVFLTVATNFKLKGVMETIDAFAKWRHSSTDRRGARLVVVGPGDHEFYRRRAGFHDLGPQVVFARDDGNIFEWYSAADAAVLLSWYDPCSRVVLEALRWGIPAVTTSFNGAAEALAGGAGIVVGSPRDARDVAAAIDRLSTADGRRPFVEACAAKAGELSVERHVKELLEAYKEAAGRK